MSKVRKSQRRKIRRRKKALRISKLLTTTLVVLALCAVFGFVAVNAIRSDIFAVNEIVVEGNEILGDSQIIEASGIKNGDNLFTLDLNKARYNINKVLSAREIYIRKVLPGKIIISITESHPIGVIAYDNKAYYISSDGKLMEITDELGNENIPLISGFNSYTFGGVGEPATLDPAYKFEQILAILKLFETNGLLNKLSEISITADNTYRIITKNGVVFTVKNAENASEYFNYIGTVIENGEVNQDINLTAANNPIKKSR